MLRFATLAVVCAFSAGAFAQTLQGLIEIDFTWNSDGPLSDAGNTIVGPPGPFTYSLGGLGCGILLTGSQNYFNGRIISKSTADWTGFFPFHTSGILQNRIFEELEVGRLSGGPVEVMTVLDFNLAVNTAGREDFVNWNMAGGNKYRGAFQYNAFAPISGQLADWQGEVGPIGEFEATPGYTLRTLSPTAKQLVFKRTISTTPRIIVTNRSMTAQTQAGNPVGPNFVELIAESKVRYKSTQPDGYILGKEDHSGSLLDRIVAPSVILTGTKRNATVYLSTRSGVDRKVFLKAVPTQITTDVTVPAYVIIPAGQTSKLFGIDIRSATIAGNVRIMAVHDSKLVTANVIATPFPIELLTINPAIIHGGQTAVATLRLAPMVVGPVQLSETSDNVTLSTATLPLILGGTANFDVLTSVVTTNQTATITASKDIYTLTRTITIVPASRLLGITVTPAVVVGGNPSTAKVSLFGPAPFGGAAVAVTSSTPFAMIPATVNIGQGTTFQTATVNTLPTLIGRTAVLIASLNGTSKTAVLTLSP